MAGTNPFRRRDNAGVSHTQHNRLTVAADRAELRFPPIETHVPKSSKGKTVRIVSPHYSRSKEGHTISAISPPPPHGAVIPPRLDPNSSEEEEEELSPVDPFTAQSDEATSQDDDDDDLRHNTIASAATSTPPPLPSLSMPVKTARKALALDLSANASTASEPPARTGLSFPASTAKRPHYDVDDFKRLLLTGEGIRPDDVTFATTISARTHALQLGHSDSHIDAPRVSRHSIFESHPDSHAESPNTPTDVPMAEDECGRPAQPSSYTRRNRPSVPISHHGKLVKQNAPQTVAFENFPTSSPDTSLPSTSLASPSPPTTPYDSKTLDKPLPPPPRSGSPIPIEQRPDLPSSAADDFDTLSTSLNRSGQGVSKRSGPALPPTRRRQQARSRSPTNESSRSTSLSEDLSQHTHPSPTNSSSTSSSKPPPLPPPRRAGLNLAPEKTDPNSSAVTTADSKEMPASKSRPPAPPSRTSSTTSIQRTSRVSTKSTASGPAPPPPPPTRSRGSSQGSFTPSGLSGEYHLSSDERARSSSGASTTHQPSVLEERLEGNDIMMDLTTLQREVDELRGKFGK
ncbi:MAG: hypothetical protein LQ344_003861 [Seirophora lacunosa]|nr:MAG: hypothetical protein LQ344_003861 [Seirophora lacunosa]